VRERAHGSSGRLSAQRESRLAEPVSSASVLVDASEIRYVESEDGTSIAYR
jgi:hypothetical protein